MKFYAFSVNCSVIITGHYSSSKVLASSFFARGLSAYKITYSSKQVQVPVLEILFDGEPISQSPIRLMVQEADCAAIYGEGSNREADGEGNCVCAGNTNELGGTCLESQYFFLIIFALVAIAMAVLVTLYLGYKKKQNGKAVFLVNLHSFDFVADRSLSYFCYPVFHIIL